MSKWVQIVVKSGLMFAYGGLLFNAVESMLESQDLTGHLHQLVVRLVFLVSVMRIRIFQKVDYSLFSVAITFLHFGFPAFLTHGNSEESLGIVGLLLSMLGMTVSVLALVDLGDSFTLLPTQTSVTRSGLYRFVRHPMYLGYIILVFGYCLSSPVTINWILLFLLISVTAIRIDREETIMFSEAYSDYKEKVPFKLIPGLY